MAETTTDRIRHLKDINPRLRRFIGRAESHGWTAEGSSSTNDCIIVRHPRVNDHFVLYPSGRGRTASLSVYDGRDGYEFSPIPTRHALIAIANYET